MSTSEAPPVVTAVAGAAASAISNVAVYPLDLIATRVQSGKGPRATNVVIAIQRILRETGPLSLYDGLSTDTLSTILSNYLFFFAHSWLHKTWAIRRRSTAKTFSAIEEIALGSLAGMLAKFVTTPIAQITVRLQSESSHARRTPNCARGSKADSDSDSEEDAPAENTIGQICHDIYAARGWSGFWAGYKSAILLTLNPSLTMYIFALLKTLLLPKSRREHPPVLITFLTSATAGGLASALTYPLILAKTRLQSRSTSGKRQYKSTSDCLAKIYNKYGLSGLYAGLNIQILKTFLSQGFTMLFKERIELLFILFFMKARNRRYGTLAKV